MRIGGPHLGLTRRGGAAAWTPAALAWDVSAGDAAGLGDVYDAASGGSAVSSEGATVNGWANTGGIGGRLGKMSDKTGPKLRLNSGVPYLEFKPATGGYALGLDCPSASSGDMTVATLFRYDATSASADTHNCLWTTLGTSSGASGRLAVKAADYSYGILAGFDSSDQVALLNSRNPLIDNSWHLLVTRRTAGSPSTWDFWFDGEKIHTGTTANTATGLSRWNIGGPMYGTGFWGDVAAFHAIRGAQLGDSDIDKLNAYYLAHPLMAAQAGGVVVWCGDSVSTPQNAVPNADGSGTWSLRYGTVRQVAGYLRSNSWNGRLYNQSRGGWSTAQHRAAGEEATAAAWLSRSTGTKVLVINTGVNDIRNGGAGLTPAQSYAQLLGLKSDLEAAVPGLTTLIGTIQDGDPTTYPAVGGTAFTSLVAELNALITGGAATHGYTAVDLTATVPGRPWGASGRGGVLTAGSDGLHPIQSGMTALADVWGPAVLALV